ncbi:PREDICTED: pentatricopeptide repeat-containing protein At2g33680-like [Nelumbo nucifera]|uniref:Pentatricopeptide repeat-containing protein At2g33680-like n=2 Tax=Nelumbo nucifera TaxID=4432 RepID=A0A1U8AWX0_NELNU|nr:PREDICTED: pentatricopeptide repeat-containing protein At2g33680-like [Nelumbo nucifera]DAD41499.1 TPA_asm: hypothetical protein HUJ06_015822 [Nelumbo nucifera]
MPATAIIEWTPTVLGSLLGACSKQRSLNMGRSIHANILKRVPLLDSDLYVRNHLVNLYAKCNKLDWAHRLFDEMSTRNTVSWTALISAYDQFGNADGALKLFLLMVSQDPFSPPNQFTYASAISACAKQQLQFQGIQLHCHALKRGFLAHILVSNVLISLYMACRRAFEAEMVFNEIIQPDQVSWNSLVSGFSQNGFLQTALEKFCMMRESGVRISCFSLSAAISSTLDDETEGKKFHGLAIKTGLNSNCFTGCTMIRMYSKFKNMEDALVVFAEIGLKDVSSWNSLIEGYGGSGQGEGGLQVFAAFMESELQPDEITMTTVLGICTNLVLLDYGKQVHSLGVKMCLDGKIRVENSLINMYSECGNLEDGLKIFELMKERSLISWTTMMGGLAHHGRAMDVIHLFQEMIREGLKPNNITYTCVLSACSHGGLVDIGQSVFYAMEIEPERDHLVCMVHLLAGGRRFKEAKEFIQGSPAEHRDSLWLTFLVACKNLGELERGIEVADKIMKTGYPTEPLALVLLSNVFAAAGRWEYVQKLRKEMKDRGMRKEPGCSWLQVGDNNEVLI